MNISSILSKDFAALVERLDADGFAGRVLSRLRRVERRRLIVVGGAGALGAAAAAAQFQPLIRAFGEAVPSINEIAISGGAATLDLGYAPMVMATLLLALAGGATALIAPGSR